MVGNIKGIRASEVEVLKCIGDGLASLYLLDEGDRASRNAARDKLVGSLAQLARDRSPKNSKNTD